MKLINYVTANYKQIGFKLPADQADREPETRARAMIYLRAMRLIIPEMQFISIERIYEIVLHSSARSLEVYVQLRLLRALMCRM